MVRGSLEDFCLDSYDAYIFTEITSLTVFGILRLFLQNTFLFFYNFVYYNNNQTFQSSIQFLFHYFWQNYLDLTNSAASSTALFFDLHVQGMTWTLTLNLVGGEPPIDHCVYWNATEWICKTNLLPTGPCCPRTRRASHKNKVLWQGKIISIREKKKRQNNHNYAKESNWNKIPSLTVRRERQRQKHLTKHHKQNTQRSRPAAGGNKLTMKICWISKVHGQELPAACQDVIRGILRLLHCIIHETK